MNEDDTKALEGFAFAAQLSGHNVQLVSDATPMPYVIKQHLGWIGSYAALATDANWRDMLDRIESQIARAQRDARSK